MNLSPREALHLIHPDLMARLAKSDQKALAQLYEQTSSLLFTLALKILGNPREAAESVLQVYVDLWRKAVRYDPRRGTPMVWLVTLTRNRAVERFRSRPAPAQPGSEQKDKGPAERDWGSGPAPKGTAGPDDVRSVVTQTLGSLSDTQRQALELAYFQGWTYADVAARLNESQDRIKAALIVGLNTLKGTLGTAWDQDNRDVT